MHVTLKLDVFAIHLSYVQIVMVIVCLNALSLALAFSQSGSCMLEFFCV